MITTPCDVLFIQIFWCGLGIRDLNVIALQFLFKRMVSFGNAVYRGVREVIALSCGCRSIVIAIHWIRGYRPI